ncbi:glycosyltransferase family 9 protein [Flavobacterium artemisiae]|uniref:Glycosyltransferase family 9 protein n=1 Tax=Flavobacterium artemisiae TaxID=2126556 RepID=A0ABW4HLA3_9FLAO
MKILIIQQKRIGDVLTSTILCNTLKQNYPDATIDFMCYADCIDVLAGNPNIDSVITLTPEIKKSTLDFLKFIFKIRSRKYTILIDVYGKLETNLISIFSGAYYKISYHKWYSSLFYNHNLKRHQDNETTENGHAIDNRLLLLKPILKSFNKTDCKPKLYVSSAENNYASSLFKKHNLSDENKIIMISLLGSEKAKTYPLEYMAKVIEFVAAERDVKILFNYFPNQIKEARTIFDLCSETTKTKIAFDLLGHDLRSFIAIMNKCDVIIGNDGGAVNIAKALDKPSFTIFSPHVRKNDWAVFENGLTNIAVHLKDYKPELFNLKSSKEIKHDFLSLYQALNPELFKEQLLFFLNQNLKK